MPPFARDVEDVRKQGDLAVAPDRRRPGVAVPCNVLRPDGIDRCAVEQGAQLCQAEHVFTLGRRSFPRQDAAHVLGASRVLVNLASVLGLDIVLHVSILL